MKTKTIFKTVALAMLMPAMLLTTACSNEDDALNNTANTENTINKGYALPVTVNVTRGDGATRASYNESTRKLEFSAGDKLFVWGIADDYEYEFAGELDYVPATEKFSGTIYTSKEWTGTADALFTAAAASDGYVNAALLPAGYGSYGFLTIEDYDTEDKYDDFIRNNNEYTFATSKAAGVEQFSYEEATTYSSGFALAPQNAILNFTITGLAASTSVNVSLTSYAYTITKTVTTDSSGNATFAAGVEGGTDFGAGVEGGTDLNSLTLTVAGNPVTLVSSEKMLEAGKIYNINRAAPAPANKLLSDATAEDIGMVVCAAGHLHLAKTAVPSGCTAVGILGKVTATGHGLILALQDAATSQTWTTINSWASVTAYASTTLKQLPDNAARSPLTSYTTLGSTTVSDWCVAPKSDYEAIFINLGSAKYDSDGYTYDANVNAYITTGVGGTAISDVYWSTTEYDGSNVWAFSSLFWNLSGKSKDTNRSLRPVLGF